MSGPQQPAPVSPPRASNASHEQASPANVANEKQQEPKWEAIEELSAAKWLKLQRITYLDRRGRRRTWDRYQRTTALPSGEADSACIVAVLTRQNAPKELLLVKQYRPALDKYTIEFPAGLIDKGETPQVTAVRELKEETGYTGEVSYVSPFLAQTVLGVEATRLVMVKVDLDREENQNPQQCEEDAGEIQVIRLPLNNLISSLQSLLTDNCVLFEGVHNLSLGLSLSADTILSPPARFGE